MAALSSSSTGAFRSPADLQEGVLLKQLKFTQFMNSAGFNQNVLKMAAENKMLVTPYTEGIYNFILQSGRGNYCYTCLWQLGGDESAQRADS